MRSVILVTAVLAVLSGTSKARAENWDYAHAGTVNGAIYTFSAVADGALKVYFMPSTGSYHSALGAKVNGTIVGSGVLPMGSTANFTPYSFGPVSAGDAIEFFIDTYDVASGGGYLGRYSSTPGDNADGLQHIWASYHPDQWYLGPEGVPEGTFIGFEDTAPGDRNGDLNYRDYTFVVPNLLVGEGNPVTATPDAVPEPASWAMMIGGFGVVGAALRRRGRRTAIAA